MFYKQFLNVFYFDHKLEKKLDVQIIIGLRQC